MSQIGHCIDLIASTLAQALPHRVISRCWRDFSEQAEADLQRGIITLVANGQPTLEEFNEWFSLTVIGQLAFADSLDGALREEAELTVLDEIKRVAWQSAPGVLRLKLQKVELSGQKKPPYGWLSIEALVGPFDSTELLCSEDELARLPEWSATVVETQGMLP